MEKDIEELKIRVSQIEIKTDDSLKKSETYKWLALLLSGLIVGAFILGYSLYDYLNRGLDTATGIAVRTFFQGETGRQHLTSVLSSNNTAIRQTLLDGLNIQNIRLLSGQFRAGRNTNSAGDKTFASFVPNELTIPSPSSSVSFDGVAPRQWPLAHPGAGEEIRYRVSFAQPWPTAPSHVQVAISSLEQAPLTRPEDHAQQVIGCTNQLPIRELANCFNQGLQAPLSVSIFVDRATISPTGFTVVVRTFSSGGRISSLDISWIAIGGTS